MANTVTRLEKRRTIREPRRTPRTPEHPRTQNTSTLTLTTEHVLTEDILETCKCNYCDCYITVGPICMIDNKIACGRCHRDDCGPRLFIVEALAKQFKFPCRYKNTGCTALLKWGMIDSHEKICDFKELGCTVADCGWVGIKSVFKVHFEQNHSSLIINSQSHLKIDLLNENVFNYLCVLDNYLFFIELDVDGEEIRHRVKSEDPCTYVYNLRIFDSTKELMFLNQDLQDNDDTDEYFNTSIKISALQSVFKNHDLGIMFEIKRKASEVERSTNKNFQCPGCLKSMLDNIYIGKCGHSFCKKCEKTLLRCPCCKSALVSMFPDVHHEIRNYSLETLIKQLSFE